MSAHTPGPWTAFGRLVRSDETGEIISFANATNARLIAAAPELLEALKAYFSDPKRFNKIASDAIAKAEGRE